MIVLKKAVKRLLPLLGFQVTRTSAIEPPKTLLDFEITSLGSRFTRALVQSQVFSENPIVVVDVGAAGGFEGHWNIYDDQIRLVGFEPRQDECAELNRQAQSKSNQRFFPIALSHTKGKRAFYTTACSLSSGMYPADMDVVSRFVDESNLNIIDQPLIDTVDFDSFARANDISCVDFMKLDCEGGELDVLKGAVDYLDDSVIGLSVECLFQPWHSGQPVFSEVDLFLRSHGFSMYDFRSHRHARKALPPYGSLLAGQTTSYGQVIWGQFIYLRDAVHEIRSGVNRMRTGWDVVKILKLVSFMEVFALWDCAIELLQFAIKQYPDFLQVVLQQKGTSSTNGKEYLLDLLMPPVRGRSISYCDYMRRGQRSAT